MVNKLLKIIDRSVGGFGAQYRTFGIFGLINYPLAYFILYYGGSQTNESLMTRLIATILCIPLIFTNLWPSKLRKYINLYWYSVILYCLPFLGTYNLLQNQMSLEWLMNVSLGIFLLVLLIDWLVFICLLSLGIILGYIFFKSTGQELASVPNFSSLFLASYIYVYAIIIGIFFARNNELMHQEKIHSMKSLAGAIAHEMRTPLLALNAMAYKLKNHLPKIIQSAQHDPNFSKNKPSVELLSHIPDSIETTTRGAFNVISILLMNLREGLHNEKVELISAHTCVESALEDYHLSDEEKPLIQWKKEKDFILKGSPLLIKHVLFNLLKNALYYVKAANKGPEGFICIYTILTQKANFLHIKDTGQGIAASMLPYIFDRFYSKTSHGTGIGLAFCKQVMEDLGGTITCRSQEGHYTEFILKFPKIKG